MHLTFKFYKNLPLHDTNKQLNNNNNNNDRLTAFENNSTCCEIYKVTKPFGQQMFE